MKDKTKYEDWKVALTYFQKSAYMIAFDLKSGYHHVDIHQDSQKFLTFAWKCPQTGLLKFYAFTVLPFGLATAPYVFTKCLKPLEKYWRLQGVKIALFLDDGWLTEYSYNDCLALANNVQSDLHKAGLLVTTVNQLGNLVWL